MTTASHGGGTRHVHFERERGVYRVAVTQGLAHVVVKVGADADRTDRLLRVFRTLADESVPIFLIKLHRTAVTFAMEESQIPHVERCMAAIGFECRVRPDLALLSIIASSMRDLTGIMVSIADSLQAAGARLYGVGDSHNAVQCLIDGAHQAEAVTQLKTAFALEDEGE